jgi:hypothetical protein
MEQSSESSQDSKDTKIKIGQENASVKTRMFMSTRKETTEEMYEMYEMYET